MTPSRSVLPLATVAVALWGVAATAWLAAERAAGLHGAVAVAAGAGVLGSALLAMRWWGDVVTARARRLAERAAGVPAAPWLAACVAAGVALRLAWIASYPPLHRGDCLDYFELGASLAVRGIYAWRDIHAYLAPGLPMTLAAIFELIGVHAWVPCLLNLVTFAAVILVVDRLAVMLAGEGVARLATALLVVWPNLVLLAGVNAKENLVLLLVPTGVLLYLEALAEERLPGAVAHAAAAGSVLGFAALTQPSTLPLPAVLAAWEVWRRGRWRRALPRLLMVGAAMTAVIAPWTARNWVVLGHLVPVSANGGHSLLVGNNPEADGGYIPIRERYPHTDEVAYDHMALRLALDWMRRNPGRVAVLAVLKQRLFLGDDSDGAYEVLRRARGIGGARYLLAKGGSLIFWVLLLWLVATALWRGRRTAVVRDSRVQLPMVLLFYLLALHSLMESGARHHVALAGFLAIFASLAALPAAANSQAGSDVVGGDGSPLDAEAPGETRR